MAGYHCTKCDETASSKCAVSRTVFPNDQYATVLGNMIKIEAVRMGSKDERFRKEGASDLWDVTYTIQCRYTKAQDEDEAIREANVVELLTSLPKETIVRAFCDHVWVLDPGTKCDLGCCEARS